MAGTSVGRVWSLRDDPLQGLAIVAEGRVDQGQLHGGQAAGAPHCRATSRSNPRENSIRHAQLSKGA